MPFLKYVVILIVQCSQKPFGFDADPAKLLGRMNEKDVHKFQTLQPPPPPNNPLDLPLDPTRNLPWTHLSLFRASEEDVAH